MAELNFWDSWFLVGNAILAATIGGGLLAYLGVFVVATRRAFVAAAVAQLSGLGVVVGLFLGTVSPLNMISPLGWSTLFGGVGASLFLMPRLRRIGNDALLASTVVGASAITLVLARSLNQDYQQVKAALFGDAVTASPRELEILVSLCLLIFLIHFIFYHRFSLVVFDPEAAQAQGMRTQRWSLLLGLTVGLSISVLTRGLGALVAFAFTVLPASSSLLLGLNVKKTLGLSVAFGTIAASSGYYLSFTADLPTGPTLVTVALVLLLLAGAMKKILNR